jgi:YidC/Oxa1 family membrane protein insertase
VKTHRNPAGMLLVWIIRGYQTFVSPAIPRSCKYYPSCSQYSIDALRQYGVLRGVVLAGWRLLRCNPWSYGGYDPVERQTLFRKRQSGDRLIESHNSGRRLSRGTPHSSPLAVLVGALLLLMSLSAVSCSFFGDTTTTAGVTTTIAGAETTVAGATTTTVAELKHPGSFDNISKPLQALFFWVLEFLHKSLGISWSWAIVLLTVIIRIILVPLTWRQIKSMRGMQALQPQLKALQEKYKNDRQVLNQKVMEFYSANHVSPFSSCLPLLLQMPVFLGLFYMLRTAGRLNLDPAEWGRWAGIFVDPPVGWLWIRDITEFNIILMFLYIASQFAASWQMSRKGAGQQKMIAYAMPLVIGVMMYIYRWPAGLFIYWFTSNLWTIGQQFAAERLIPVRVATVVTPDSEKGAQKRPAGKTPAGTGTKRAPAKPGGKAPAKTGGKTPSAPAGKSGGVISGQKTGQKGTAAGSQSQRPDGGTGGSTGSGGA